MTNLVNEDKHIFCYIDLHGHSWKCFQLIILSI